MITLEKMQNLGKLFFDNDCDGILSSEAVFDFCDRHSHLILSAPHSTNSFICKAKRRLDLFTGELALVLGEERGVSTIVRNKFVEQKVLVSDFVIEKDLGDHFFLDLHGMSAEHDFELAIGTAYFEPEDYKKELDLIGTLAEKYQIKFVINHPDYCGDRGLTGRYQQHYNKPNVLQLEWRPDCRNYYDHSEIVLSKTIPFLSELACKVNRKDY